MSTPTQPTAEMDDDPYAPRSHLVYTRDDQRAQSQSDPNPHRTPAASSSPPPAGPHASTPSSSSSASSSTAYSSATPTASSSATASAPPLPRRSNAPPSRPPPQRITRASEEPMFGGRPFRDSHRAQNFGPDEGGADDATEGVTSADDDGATTQPSGGGGGASASSQRDGLYAVLNIERDATEEQIRDAYRSLAVLLHPDKHSDPARKAAAESRFREVQRAYEVLSDAERRAVYDHFGEAGLASSWSLTTTRPAPGSGIGASSRRFEDLRAEMERESRRRLEEDAEALVNSRGDIEARFDASALFCSPERVPRSRARVQSGEAVTWTERWNRVGCTQLTGKHGFESQLTRHTRGVLTGQLVSKSGLGGGNIIGTLRTHWGPRLWTETTATMLRPRIFSVKGQYELSPFSFVTFAANSPTIMIPPQLQLTYGQRLSARSGLVGFTSLKSGTYYLGPWGRNFLGFGPASGAGLGADDDASAAPLRWIGSREPPSVSVGLSSQPTMEEAQGGDKASSSLLSTSHTFWTAQASLGVADQGVSVDWGTRSHALGGARVKVGFNLGTASGVTAFSDLERRVTENVRVGVGVHASIPLGGVTLRLRLQRLGQRVGVPVKLAPEFRSDLALACAVVPALALALGERYVLRPAKRRRVARRLSELRRGHAELIRERRRAAEEALQVLAPSATKRARSEWSKAGVVVVEAVYGRKGDLPPVTPRLATARAGQSETTTSAQAAAATAADSAVRADLSEDVEAVEDADWSTLGAEELFQRAWGGEGASEAAAPLSSDVHADGDGDGGGAAPHHEEGGRGAAARRADELGWWDVRIPVQALVNKGQLIIPGGRSKAGLLGFYDPCMGERKELRVRYLFRNELHECVVEDGAPLAAPLRSHRI